MVHYREHKVGGRDRMTYPEYADLASRKHYLMSEQAASTNLGSIALTASKTFYIDTIIAHNLSSTLKAQVILTLTSTSSSPIFAFIVPELDTVVITGLVGLNTSTATCLYYQVGNAGNIFSTGALIGGWEIDAPYGT